MARNFARRLTGPNHHARSARARGSKPEHETLARSEYMSRHRAMLHAHILTITRARFSSPKSGSVCFSLFDSARTPIPAFGFERAHGGWYEKADVAGALEATEKTAMKLARLGGQVKIQHRRRADGALVSQRTRCAASATRSRRRRPCT